MLIKTPHVAQSSSSSVSSSKQCKTLSTSEIELQMEVYNSIDFQYPINSQNMFAILL